MQVGLPEGTGPSLNTAHQQQQKANHSLAAAQGGLFSGKIPKQSQMDNAGGAQLPTGDWGELLGTAGVAFGEGTRPALVERQRQPPRGARGCASRPCTDVCPCAGEEDAQHQPVFVLGPEHFC